MISKITRIVSFTFLGIVSLLLTTQTANAQCDTTKRDFKIEISKGCAKRAVSLTVNPRVSPKDSLALYWDFADGKGYQLAGDSVVIVYNPGSYNVSLRIQSNKLLSTGTVCQTINKVVNNSALPTPNFSAPTLKFCNAPFKITLNDVTTGLSSSRLSHRKWIISGPSGTKIDSFGPATTQDTFSLNQVGAYTVTLQLFDSFGCNSVTQKTNFINIPDPIKVDFCTDLKFGTVKQDSLYATFTPRALSGQSSIVRYVWDYGDGTKDSTTTLQIRTKNYGSTDSLIANAKTITLTGKTVDGCISTFTQPNIITRYAKPITNASRDICLKYDTAYQFTQSGVTGTGKTGFTATSSAAGATVVRVNNSIHTYRFTNPGKSEVRFSFNYGVGTCSNTITIPNVFNALAPKADFTSLQRNFCGPDTVRFRALNKAVRTTYTWFLCDTQKINPVHLQKISDTLGENNFIITNPGLYSLGLKMVTRQANGKVCTDSIFKYGYFMLNKPIPNFTVNIPSICNGTALDLLNTTTPRDTTTTPYIYTWIITHSTKPLITKTINGRKPNITMDTLGDYDIKLAVINGVGSTCTDTLTKLKAFTINGVTADVVINAPTPACPPITNATMEATINNNLPSTSTLKYYWDVYDGNGDTSAVTLTAAERVKQKATFSLSSSGVGAFSVKVRIISSVGCSTTVNKVGALSAGTKAVWSAIKVGCLNTDIQLNNSSEFNPDNYTWSVVSKPAGSNPLFSGGTATSTITAPTIRFDRPGKYAIRLVAGKGGNASCNSQMIDTITIIQPLADFNASEREKYCAPQLFTLRSKNKGMAKYEWNFGIPGDTSYTLFTDTTATVLYKNNNNLGYDVTLRITTPEGCVHSLTKNAYLKIIGPQPKISYSNKTFCGAGTVRITNQSLNIKKFSFDYRDGSPIDSVPFTVVDHYYRYGDYNKPQITYYPQVVTSDSLFGCFETFTDSIFLYRPPIAQMQFANPVARANGTISGCAPFEVSFSDISRYNTAREWDFNNDGFVDDTATNPKFTYTTPGVYSVKLKVSNFHGPGNSVTCTDTTSKMFSVIVYGRPKAGIGFSDYVICPNKNVTYYDSGSVGIINGYLWDFGDTTATSSDRNPTHSYLYEGVKTVKLTVRSNNPDGTSCFDSTTKNLVVNLGSKPNPPTINFVTVDTSVSPTYPSGTVKVSWEKFTGLSNLFSKYELYKDGISGTYYSSNNINTVNYDDQDLTIDPYNNTYSYTMATFNQCGLPSDLSEQHTTMKLKAVPLVTLQGATNQLNWTPYIGWGTIGGVAKYEIWRKEFDDNGFRYSLRATVDGTTTEFIDTGLCNNLYRYVIAAVHPLDSNIKSLSNKDSVQALYAFPARIMVRYATVNNNEVVKIKWDLTKQQNMVRYILERKASNETKFVKIGDFPIIQDTFIDLDPLVKTSADYYSYRVLIEDRCGFKSTYSNVGTTILLNGEVNKEEINYSFFWNAYDSFEYGIANYYLQLKDNNGVWNTVKQIDPSYVDDIFDSIKAVQPIDGPTCFRLIAVANPSNDFPAVIDSSTSNEVCLILPSIVFVPNAFTPGNTIGINDEFNPFNLSILGNVEREELRYEFKVYDRWGVNVFETNDKNKGWDGTFKGKECPQDVYTYYVKAYGLDKKTIFRRGSVTLLR